MLANSGHTPFDTRIFLKEAKTLSKAGYEVTIIIPALKDDSVDNISIKSVALHKKGWKKLIVCPWLVFRQALRQPRDSFFHLHDSELLIIGILLKLSGRAVVYDAHEDTPQQIMYQHWIPSLLKMPYRWFYTVIEKVCGWMFDGIIVAEPVIAKYFPLRKTSLIRNFPIIDHFNKELAPYAQRDNSLVYFGLVSEARGALHMARAAAKASEKCSFRFLVGGSFSPRELEKEVCHPPITFLGWLQFEQMADILVHSKAGIHVPEPIERYKTNYPVKLFEYMAAGLPVIATKYGEVANFVTEANCGILVDPENENEIADAIEKIFKNDVMAAEMGARGRAMVFSKYSWEKEAQSLLNFYSKLFATTI